MDGGASIAPSHLHVCFTMDCERIAAESPPGGPESWEVSERAIVGYFEALLAHDLRPTFFVTPECALEHRSLLDDLAGQGAELGLHVHPQSLGDHRYTRCLGEYGRAKQREVLRDAMVSWAKALGRAPTCFRGGNFSASDETFPVLVELGFTHGSASDPGRYAPGMAACWEGACPDPHLANREDRLRPGDLPFLEVPLTTDPSRRQPNGFPYELRIESGSLVAWHQPILKAALARLSAQEKPLRVLVLFTHNYWDYGDRRTLQRRTLDDLVAYIRRLGPLRGPTLGEIRGEFPPIGAL